MKKILSYSLVLLVAVSFAACKVDDPFVDRVVAPVLVDIVGASFGAPLSSEPTVSYATSGKVMLTARLLELDKSGILDKNIGIDSIPVANIPMKITLRNGASLGEVTSNAQGVVSLEKTWAELGVASPKAGTVVKISWSGNYKGIAFTRLSQVQAK
ncbi:hypothetical protein [Persicitalea jodogahamensis]|uniref:Uncharacterized protein n=1 Tax=Persicitalea jodogahamensis TaxID=402147 RepID=A0A8J3D1E2_9BACT|nr:hypothetical protein [Persicitalea jodogahamensis]GHB56176.1 hypothetical protein GCM10007390_06850 [Persicitalea jodogahamensis]